MWYLMPTVVIGQINHIRVESKCGENSFDFNFDNGSLSISPSPARGEDAD